MYSNLMFDRSVAANNITNITLGTFSGLSALTILYENCFSNLLLMMITRDLSGNPAMTIPSDLFAKNSNLTTLFV